MSTSHRLLIFYLFVTSSLISTIHGQRTYQRSCECERTVDGKCAYTLVLPLDTGGKQDPDSSCKGGCLPPNSDFTTTNNINESLNSLRKGVDHLEMWTGEQAKMMTTLLNKMTSLEQTTSGKNFNEDYKKLQTNISEQSLKLRKLETDLEQVNNTMTNFINQITSILAHNNITTSSNWSTTTTNNLNTTMANFTTYNNFSTPSFNNSNFNYNHTTSSNHYFMDNTTTTAMHDVNTTKDHYNNTADITMTSSNYLTTPTYKHSINNETINQSVSQRTTYKPIDKMDNFTTNTTNTPQNVDMSWNSTNATYLNFTTISPHLFNNNNNTDDYNTSNNYSSTIKHYSTPILPLNNTFQQFNATTQQNTTNPGFYNNTIHFPTTPSSYNETLFNNKTENKEFGTTTRVPKYENNTNKDNSSEWTSHNLFHTTAMDPHSNETTNVTLTTTYPNNESSHSSSTTNGRNIFVEQTSSTNHIQLSSESHFDWAENNESVTTSQPSWTTTNQSENWNDKNKASEGHRIMTTTTSRDYNNTFDDIHHKLTTEIPLNTFRNLFTLADSSHNMDATSSAPNMILKRKKRDLGVMKSSLPNEVSETLNSLILRIVDLESKLKLWEERGRFLCSKKGSFLANNGVSAITQSTGMIKNGKTKQSNDWCIESANVGQSVKIDFRREERIFSMMIKITSAMKGFFYISYAGVEQVWNVYAGPGGETQIFTALTDDLDHYQHFELWQPITVRSIKIHPIDDANHQRLCFSADFIGCMD